MNNRRNKGFTLVELNIASFITLLLFAALLSLYIVVWRSLTIGNTYLDTYAGSRNASGWLIRDVRCAAQVVKQYPETGSPVYQTDDHVIVLKVPSVHKDTNQIISSYYDYIIYYRLESGDLMRIVRTDQRFNNAEDPYYTKSYREDDANPVVITRYCKELTFSSFYTPTAEWKKLSFYDDSMMKDINAISIYLPINKSNISLGVTGTEKMNPTTVIRLRNK
jgi:hypothetical protein